MSRLTDTAMHHYGERIMSRDLTTGSVWKHIIILALTTFLGMGIQQLYSLADTAALI